MGLITHLCVKVNAKKIVVAVTVVRPVLEVLVIAGVVATIKKAGGGAGEGSMFFLGTFYCPVAKLKSKSSSLSDLRIPAKT